MKIKELRKSSSSSRRPPVAQVDSVVQDLVIEAAEFLKNHGELHGSVPAEDYDDEVIALTTAAAQLTAIMRSFAFKFDDTAEAVNLSGILKAIESEYLPTNMRIRRPRSLPVIHMNRRRMEALFLFLIGDAIRAKAKTISLTMPRLGHFRLADDRPKTSQTRRGDHFALTAIDGDGRVRPNIDLYLAKEIVGFYGGVIRVSFTARSVELDFTLPTEG